MYAVGRPHPLRLAAQRFFEECRQRDSALHTSAEVVQELLHAYLLRGDPNHFAAALELIRTLGVEVWPLEFEDVVLASRFEKKFATLKSRDLCPETSAMSRAAAAGE